MKLSNSKMLFIVVIGFALLGFYVLLNQSNTDESKIFSPENFYEGESHDEVDPKAQYDYFASGALSDATCNSKMPRATHSNIVGSSNLYWVSDVDGISSDSDVFSKISESCVDTSSYFYTPFSEGDSIVAPSSLEFINSNIEQTSSDRIDILCQTSDGEYQVLFTDVDRWWCHIGKSSSGPHSTKYGKGGSYSSCSRGSVIGKAKSSTVVQVKKKDLSGVYSPVSLEDFYKGVY